MESLRSIVGNADLMVAIILGVNFIAMIVMTGISLRDLRASLRAQVRLTSNLREQLLRDAILRARLSAMDTCADNPQAYAAALQVLEEAAAVLETAERQAAESALHQPTKAGRFRYVRTIVHDALMPAGHAA
ncbi:hypothetical protein [Caenispirillum bisanense]|uniref:hypothetical protein n=1 Tax=Caenispirillum bisanense TaxID=414052 RepID=UPI000BE31F87|nr:hypothetical protein [Caenispirillum bisanense]